MLYHLFPKILKKAKYLPTRLPIVFNIMFYWTLYLRHLIGNIRTFYFYEFVDFKFYTISSCQRFNGCFIQIAWAPLNIVGRYAIILLSCALPACFITILYFNIIKIYYFSRLWYTADALLFVGANTYRGKKTNDMILL